MKCKYVYEHNPGKQCPHEAVEGSEYCIFHLKKEFKDFRGWDLEKEDLEEAFLVKAKFDDAKLTGAILNHANLEEASLINVDLSNAKLMHAKLEKANLFNADLSGTKLTHAVLTEANLENADLSNAIISGAKMTEANLRNSDMSNVHSTERVILRKSSLINSDLSEAELDGADLEEADLSNCDLSSARLTGANLKNSKAVNADFSYAHLESVDMTEINAVNADFSHAYLNKAIVSKATLMGSDFSYAHLISADFSDVTLEGCIFHGTDVKDVEFKNAGVRYGREWEYAKNVTPLRNEKIGKEYERNKEWKKAFAEFCYASKIYNDLSYYFKERGIGKKEDEFLIKKWEMNERAGKAFLELDTSELGEKETKLLEEVLGLSKNSKLLKTRIKLKIFYYKILKRGFFTDFVKVLAVSVFVVVIFSLLYWTSNAITSGSSTVTFWEALYFSIVTFTTLGYGDYHPRPNAPFQFLASVEAVLGMILLSLFVVTLYRRVVR